MEKEQHAWLRSASYAKTSVHYIRLTLEHTILNRYLLFQLREDDALKQIIFQILIHLSSICEIYNYWGNYLTHIWAMNNFDLEMFSDIRIANNFDPSLKKGKLTLLWFDLIISKYIRYCFHGLYLSVIFLFGFWLLNIPRTFIAPELTSCK